MAIRYSSVTVISCGGGETLQCRANEMELPPGTCTISGLRAAPVRLVVRDDATAAEILQALEAGRANLDKLLDALPHRGGGGGYIP